MAKPDDTPSMAVFCDFENVALGVRDAKYDKFDIRKVLERLLLKGSIVVKKAYCDWARYREFKAEMHEASFELIEIPHVRQSGKNSADIRLVVDALDLCYTKSHVDTFVIISGDSDFSPLVSKLRENAKTVIGVGVKGSTSDLLTANCDEFIFYDDLVREQRRRGARDAARREGPREAGRSEAVRDTGRDTGRSAGGNGRGPRPGEREPLRVVPNTPAVVTAPPEQAVGTLEPGEPMETSDADRVGGPWRRQGSGAASTLPAATDGDGSAGTPPSQVVGPAADAHADAANDVPAESSADAAASPATPAPRSRTRRSRARIATAAASTGVQADVAATPIDAPPPAHEATAAAPADVAVATPAGEVPPAEAVGPKKRAPRRRKAAAGDEAEAAAPPATTDAEPASPAAPPATAAPSATAPLPAPRTEPERPRPRSDEDRRQDAIDLAIETVEALITERGADDKIWGSMVKQTLKRRRPGFAESYYGYRSFNELLEDARDRGLLALERDEKSGGYVIRLL